MPGAYRHVVPKQVVIVEFLFKPLGQSAFAGCHARNACTDCRNKSRHPGVTNLSIHLPTLCNDHHAAEWIVGPAFISGKVMTRYSVAQMKKENIWQSSCGDAELVALLRAIMAYAGFSDMLCRG